MENIYYGTPEASSDFLIHYGVKGMRWGVRRAVKSGDSYKLRKQYMKATKKLGKLSLNANRNLQKKRYADAKARMAQGAAISAAGSAGLTAVFNKNVGWKERAATAGIAGLAGGIGGAIINSQGIGAKRYISDKGHAKAITKRDAWRKDMESAFKGTTYGGKQQRQFHKEIIGLSSTRDPKGYVRKQQKKLKRT